MFPVLVGTKSATKRFHVPLGAVPLNTEAKVAGPAGAGFPYVAPGPGAGKLSSRKKLVGIYVPAAQGPNAGSPAEPKSASVYVTLEIAPVPAPSWINKAAPVGPTKT